MKHEHKIVARSGERQRWELFGGVGFQVAKLGNQETSYRLIANDFEVGGFADDGAGFRSLEEFDYDRWVGEAKAEELGDVSGAGYAVDLHEIRVSQAAEPVGHDSGQNLQIRKKMRTHHKPTMDPGAIPLELNVLSQYFAMSSTSWRNWPYVMDVQARRPLFVGAVWGTRNAGDEW